MIPSLGGARGRSPGDPSDDDSQAAEPARVEGQRDKGRAALKSNVNDALYSGQLTPHDAQHALTGLVQGVMAIGRAPRGSAKLGKASPHVGSCRSRHRGYRFGKCVGRTKVSGI